jgi:hypothetical protein
MSEIDNLLREWGELADEYKNLEVKPFKSEMCPKY